MKRVKGRVISKGKATGEVLLSEVPVSFLGSINPVTGVVVEEGHPLKGKCVAGKVLVFPRGKGSTVSSYVLFQLKKNGKAPAAIINVESEVIVAVGAIISDIPMMDELEEDPFKFLEDGCLATVNADEGFVEIG